MEESEIILAFGKVLKKLREERGISQEKLAHAIGSHFTHISRLENGHKQPTLTTMFKLSEVLKIEPEEIVIRIAKSLKSI